MRLGYTLDDRYLAHQAPGPASHPESPARLDAIRRELHETGLAERMHLVQAREATRAELEACHDPRYLDLLERELDGPAGYLDSDTFFSAGTRAAAWLAAGTTTELALQVASGSLDAGIALVRPPGHHATRSQAMGFCLLDNVAIAARAIQQAGLARRVLIFDWDVHHGNGTEDIFWDDPNVMFVSIHQHPHYPGTGQALIDGGSIAAGTTVNVPLPAGCGDGDYLAVYEQVVVPAANWFGPDFILVSAGYDAYHHDPLGGMKVSRKGFATLASRLFHLAGRNRVVAVLEGGYVTSALGGFVADLAKLWLGDTDIPTIDGPTSPSHAALTILGLVFDCHARRWQGPPP